MCDPIKKAARVVMRLLFFWGITSPNLASELSMEHNKDRPQIHVWYGNTQHVGQRGKAQKWVNLLGHVSHSSEVQTMDYSLNGASPIEILLGPDGRRLDAPGDFNIDIGWEILKQGKNFVQISLRLKNNVVVTTSVTLINDIQRAQGSFQLSWEDYSSIQRQAHVVDGNWRITNRGIRTEEPGYDRFVAIGDVSWSNYEVTVPITMHNLAAESGGVGLLTGWTGHTENPFPGYQPKAGFLPLGCIGWYRKDRLEFYGNNSVILARTPADIVEGGTYMFKMRVRTTRDDEQQYQLKVWPQSRQEPDNWSLEAYQTGGNSAGSILLTAHEYDVTFGDINVIDLSGN